MIHYQSIPAVHSVPGQAAVAGMGYSANTYVVSSVQQATLTAFTIGSRPTELHNWRITFHRSEGKILLTAVKGKLLTSCLSAVCCLLPAVCCLLPAAPPHCVALPAAAAVLSCQLGARTRTTDWNVNVFERRLAAGVARSPRSRRHCRTCLVRSIPTMGTPASVTPNNLAGYNLPAWLTCQPG